MGTINDLHLTAWQPGSIGAPGSAAWASASNGPASTRKYLILRSLMYRAWPALAMGTEPPPTGEPVQIRPL